LVEEALAERPEVSNSEVTANPSVGEGRDSFGFAEIPLP